MLLSMVFLCSSFSRFAITNSIIVTLLITTVVAATFVRTLRGDLEKYNDMDKEEALEETVPLDTRTHNYIQLHTITHNYT